MKTLRFTILLILLFIHAFAQDTVFKNKYYTFYFKPEKNSIGILSSNGGEIISASSFRQLLIDTYSNDTVLTRNNVQSFQKKKTGESTEIMWMDSNSYCVNVFKAVLFPNSEEIKISVTTDFKKDVQVIRDAMILTCSQPLSEVYRRNSTIDKTDFQTEYWLNKEGARFGNAEKTLLIYHVTGVSSLQLNTVKNQLVINLDYNRDHPFQHFPMRDSMMNEKVDLSCSIYKAGEERKNYFSLHAGKQIDFVPRLMLNPNGFLAVHIFTEHADWTDLPTHRAVYFGSEEITNTNDAIGGFVKNNIPVTKSVFYSNPDNVLNSQSRHKSIFTTPIATIRGTSGYLEFLQQLQKKGNEICLHTPDQFTSQQQLIEEACAFMKKKFDAVTWIDHGYNNGSKNNREAFVCDGLNPASPSFAKDIWGKYGVKYFWNSYYEDFISDDSLFFDFNGSLMHPYPGFGDASPAPLYWQSPTRTGNFYSWPTRDLLEMPDPASWNFHFSTERLNDFVQQRAVKFQHCYPAGSIADRGYWKLGNDKRLVVDPNFEKALEQLASFRDRGLINLTTVRALLDYWIACENIHFEYLDSTTVIIRNKNKFHVQGISFAVSAKQITTTNKFQQKFIDGDLIFWMDLKPEESIRLNFSK